MKDLRVLLVDDDEDSCKLIQEYLKDFCEIEDTNIVVEYITKFNLALEYLEARKIDLLILDVRIGDIDDDLEVDDEAGRKTLKAIQENLFVPVIFHTGLPRVVEDLASNLIRVVPRENDSPKKLLTEIESLLKTGLPALNRAIIKHTEKVQRSYMWGFVNENWPEFEQIQDRNELAHLLARRLAISFSFENVGEIETGLGESGTQASEANQAHSMRYYVLPPISIDPQTCDLYRDETGLYWVLLTPSCDMVMREKNGRSSCSADYFMFAGCASLTEQTEYAELKEHFDSNPLTEDFKTYEDLSGKHKKLAVRLRKFLLNNPEKRQKGRYFFLPKAWRIPDLIVDFQNVKAIPLEEVFSPDSKLERIASVDSPFRESLISRFNSFFGRIGTPDLDVEIILRRLISMTSQ
ncbi:response regulator [[Leptolyngbya] sp. PCC 7376]|uniref:response regulator n=1 Tax=[Leptolyngbya] sp. PCC 7376 TaxID=111781 RepID=UPI0005A215EF|nr:response regulator [[Leptolyngbya] sp. PCC 7376]